MQPLRLGAGIEVKRPLQRAQLSGLNVERHGRGTEAYKCCATRGIDRSPGQSLGPWNKVAGKRGAGLFRARISCS